MKDHITCLKQTPHRREAMCPYAYAYLHWRQFILGYKYIWEINNRYGHNYEGGEIRPFISNQDSYHFSRLMYNWEDRTGERRYHNLAAAQWIINKAVGIVLLNHFKNWLRVARGNAEIGKIYSSVPFDYENMPFFAISHPDEKNQPIEFHWWTNKDNDSDLQMDQFQCPNKTKK